VGAWLIGAVSALGQIELTDASGNKAMVEVRKVTAKDATVLANGRVMTVPLSSLDPASVISLKKHADERGLLEVFPPVRINAMAGTSKRQGAGASYTKDQTIKPFFSIEGQNISLPIPAAQATMLVVVQDTYAKEVQRQNTYKVQSIETMLIPAVAAGTKRTFDFRESTVTFDADHDTSNVGGFIYKWYIFVLKDKEHDAVVEIQTNNARLKSAMATDASIAVDLMKLKEGSSFPTKFE